MKASLIFFCLSIFCLPICALAQQKTRFGQKADQPATASACDDLNVSMAVKLSDSKQAAAEPGPDKAEIYFIQDTGLAITLAYPTTKIGIDGKWVGANKKDSYFSVTVDPGEHHLCAAIQSSLVPNSIELAHLTTEPGKMYYYRTRIIMSKDGPVYLGFVPVDSDEARYMIASYPQATAHARK